MVEKVDDGLGVNSSHSNLLRICKDAMFGGRVNRILCSMFCHTLRSASVVFNVWIKCDAESENNVKEDKRERPQFRHNRVADSSSRARKSSRGRERGRKKDEGDPPVIAGATWGPTQGLGLILKWPERLQTQQASKQSWLHCGMSLPHWPTHFTNITDLLATARLADQQYRWCVT